MVVIRLELADQSPSPRGFQYSAGEFPPEELSVNVTVVLELAVKLTSE